MITGANVAHRWLLKSRKSVSTRRDNWSTCSVILVRYCRSQPCVPFKLRLEVMIRAAKCYWKRTPSKCCKFSLKPIPKTSVTASLQTTLQNSTAHIQLQIPQIQHSYANLFIEPSNVITSKVLAFREIISLSREMSNGNFGPHPQGDQNGGLPAGLSKPRLL